MKVIEIVKAHLIQHGFDGLVHPDAECGCLMAEGLQPCGEDNAECEAGYRIDDPVNLGRWLVTTEKPEPDTLTADLFAGQEGGAGA